MANPCGMLTQVPEGLGDTSLYYVSLNDFNVLTWAELGAQAPAQGHAVVQLADQQNTLDLSCLLRDSGEYGFPYSHKGLVLISVRRNRTYQVYNPLYRETVNLPSPPSLPETAGLRSLNEAVIINLSDDLPNTPCNFMVFRIRKDTGNRKFAQICRSADNLQWNEALLVHNPNRFRENWICNWSLCGSVFLHNTLFCLVGSDHRCIVGIRFSDPIAVYSLDLPEDPANPTLLASQGSLYVAYARRDYLVIWRYNGDLQVAEPWAIQQPWTRWFLFNGNDEQDGNDLIRNPQAMAFLNDIRYRVPLPLNMHPQQPFLYIYRDRTISGFHLHNDEPVNNTHNLEDDPVFSADDNYLFSPCVNHLI